MGSAVVVTDSYFFILVTFLMLKWPLIG